MKSQLSKEICIAFVFACGAVIMLGCENMRAESVAVSPDAASPGDAADPEAKRSTDDRVLVMVNAAPIYESDLNSSLAQAGAGLTGADADADEANKKLTGQVLEKLVQDELLIQHARHKGLFITDEQIDARLNKMIETGGGATAFQAFIERSGLSADRLRTNLARNLLIERLIESLRSEVQISDAQLRAHFELRRKHYTEPQQVELVQIEFGRGQAAMQTALATRARIADGLDFEQAAKRSGRGHVAAVLGRFSIDDLLPVFAGAVSSLAAGQVSTPVEGPAGIVLLKVASRSGGEAPPFEQVRERIASDLLVAEVQKRLGELTERLTRDSNIQRYDLP
jgi:parvulin-like peptidyl-prolyl isomerase